MLILGAIEKVDQQPACVGPLLVVPNERNAGYRVFHDLSILNRCVVERWGPLVNRHHQLLDVPTGNIFSTFDLYKCFLQIQIPKGDRHYFWFYFKGQFTFVSDSHLVL